MSSLWVDTRTLSFHFTLDSMIRLQDNEFNQSEDVIGRVVCGIRMCVFVARGVHECAAV